MAVAEHRRVGIEIANTAGSSLACCLLQAVAATTEDPKLLSVNSLKFIILMHTYFASIDIFLFIIFIIINSFIAKNYNSRIILYEP